MSMSGRYTLLVSAAIAISCASPSRVPAQPAPLAPGEVSQIVDAALAAVLAPEKQLSRVAVADRTIRFDHVRTLSAFGQPGASLTLARDVKQGSRDLIPDCERGASCRSLGWSVYAWAAPITISESEATVRLWAYWPDRGGQAFDEATAPTGKATVVGFGMEVHLKRDATGRWVFVRTGTAIVS